MSEDSDYAGSDGVSEDGHGSSVGRDCGTFFMQLALIVFGLVSAAEFLRSCEDFRPRTAHILKSEEWKPFIRDCTDFSKSIQNMDDGSIVFVMQPDFDDWESYLRTIIEDAAAIGWVKDTDEDERLAEASYFVKRRVLEILKWDVDIGVPVRNFFTLKLDPKETGGRTVEVVEITLLDKKGAVLFVSFYL